MAFYKSNSPRLVYNFGEFDWQNGRIYFVISCILQRIKKSVAYFFIILTLFTEPSVMFIFLINRPLVLSFTLRPCMSYKTVLATVAPTSSIPKLLFTSIQRVGVSYVSPPPL